MKRYKVLDLFAGGGGFSTGFLKARYHDYAYEIIRAMDIDKHACNTLSRHLGNEKVIKGDITNQDIKDDLIHECQGVDVIIGGPPCQTYSLAGPARSGSQAMREALRNDPRNKLYKHFFEIVDELKPRFVVFENVTGIVSKTVDENGLSNGDKVVIEAICDELESIGYRTEIEDDYELHKRYQILNAADYGVPQYRKRVIIIANRYDVDNPVPVKTYGEEIRPYRTVQDTIAHLPVVLPKITLARFDKLKKLDVIEKNFAKSLEIFVTGMNQIAEFYRERPEVQSEKFQDLMKYINEEYCIIRNRKRKLKQVLYKFLEGYNEKVNGLNQSTSIDSKTTVHLSRQHNFRDIIIFMLMKQGSNSARFMNPNLPDYDSFLDELYPYARANHKDTYVKHSWDRPSNTILAHMEKDGLKFIHPVQPRAFTPYEAALIQSFPPDYEFCGNMNAQYKQIGNAVPPSLAESIGNALLRKIVQCERECLLDKKLEISSA